MLEEGGVSIGMEMLHLRKRRNVFGIYNTAY